MSEITLEGVQVTLRLSTLLPRLSLDSKLRFIKELSCDAYVVRHVADLILEDSTPCGSGEPFSGALDRARRDVALRSGEVARREIERLEDALARSRAEVAALLDALRRLPAPRDPEPTFPPGYTGRAGG